MAKYNIVAKRLNGREYIITDMIATRLSSNQWEKIKEANPQIFGDTEKTTWRYIPHEDTDFSWWEQISKKLTPSKIVEKRFKCSYDGDITEF